MVWCPTWSKNSFDFKFDDTIYQTCSIDWSRFYFVSSLGIRKKIFYVHKVRWLVKLLLKLTKVCLIKMLNRLEEIKPSCICVRLVFSDASIFKWDSIQNGSKNFMNSFLQLYTPDRMKSDGFQVLLSNDKNINFLFLSYYCWFGIRKCLSLMIEFLEKKYDEIARVKTTLLHCAIAHIALHFVALRNLLIQSDNESLGCTQFSGPWNGIPNHCIAHWPYSAKHCPKNISFCQFSCDFVLKVQVIFW